jgi:hypothetical protein
MILAAIAAGAALLTLPAVAVAQLDTDAHTSTPHSPRVIVEEPRPPAMAIETEGRGERHDCRSVTVTERRNGIPVTHTEQRCDR